MEQSINKASEIKQRIQAGWELWYIANRECPKLPGKWQMRYRNQIAPVHWDAIERARRNLDWFRDNTIESEVGRNWVYKFKQRDLLAAQLAGVKA